MTCKKCGNKFTDRAKFCSKCGNKVEISAVQESLTKKCPACGSDNPVSAKFCKKDGYNFHQSEEKPGEKNIAVETPEGKLSCPVCGVSYSLSIKFCNEDGAPLHGRTSATDIPERSGMQKEINPATEIKEMKPSRRLRTLAWLTAVVIVSVAAGAASYLFFLQNITFKDKPPKIAEKIAEPPKETTAPNPVQVEAPKESGKQQQTVETKPSEIKKQDVSEPKPPAAQKRLKKTKEVALMPSESVEDVLARRIEIGINNDLLGRGLYEISASVTKNMVAILRGTVQSAGEKNMALSAARSYKGIKDVWDDIQVNGMPTPVSPAAVVKTDPAKLEGDINRALRGAGLRGIAAEVADNLDIVLRGTVQTYAQKEAAFVVAKKFREVRKIGDKILVMD